MYSSSYMHPPLVPPLPVANPSPPQKCSSFFMASADPSSSSCPPHEVSGGGVTIPLSPIESIDAIDSFLVETTLLLMSP